MTTVIIDTNVLIAGLRSQSGASHEVLRRIGTGRFDIAISVPLVLEYELVAKRMHRELGLGIRDIDDIIDYICSVGIAFEIHYLWRPLLRDPKDDMILEIAANSQANAIITHNTRDFDKASELGITVMTPKDFLHLLKEKR